MAYFPFILILAIMYFLMIRPQAKRQKEKQAIKALKKGDKVVTIGGIHGSVSGFKGKDGNTILLQVDSNAKITINRSSVSSLASQNDSQNELIEEK